MPVSRQLPPLPEANVPLAEKIVIDGVETYFMTDAWRKYFVSLMAVLGEIRGLIP